MKRFNGKVGKKIGQHVWLHKTSAHTVLSEIEQEEINATHFNFDVVRVNLATREIALIKCESFDSQHEPVIESTLNLLTGRRTEMQTNPLIYHHKHLMVCKDTYQGFDVAESELRSHTWLSRSPRTRTFSSKIGRKMFWSEWLNEQGLEQ